MKHVSLLLFFFLCLSSSSFTQTFTPFFQGDLRAYLSSHGALQGPADLPWLSLRQGDEWPSLVREAGLWIGGTDINGNLHVVDVSAGGEPGPVDGDPAFEGVWGVTAEEVEDHRQDFADNGMIDNPIESIYAWPARGNPFFADYNGFDLPQTTQTLAPFYDAQGDGLYNPEDGDFPILTVRGCDEAIIIPSQMLWTIFTALNDQPDVGPLEFQAVLFSTACTEDHPLNETIFLKYRVFNAGPNSLENCRWGLYADPDLGCPSDDYVGSFPARQTGYAYNATNEDADCEGLQGLGTNPPAIGMDVYRGPLDIVGEPAGFGGIQHFFNAAYGNPPPGTTDPNTAEDYYEYLRGYWPTGDPLTIGGIGFGEIVDTNFCFPGFPDQGGGWTEWDEGNFLGDRRLLSYFEEFELLPGAVNETFAAFSVHRDGTDHLDQVVGLQDQMDVLQAFFDMCFATDFLSPSCTQMLTDVAEPEAQLDWQLSPNPATELVWISLPETASGQLLVYDLTGRLLKQEMVRSSQMSLDVASQPAGMYLVVFQDETGRQFTEKLIIE